jgi:3-deoxy-manno-octulosonate cytidylyltransferase (CMP-KDO synthetase)
MKTVCVIPSRYGSTRLPGKPLIPLNGRPMIQWVIEAAQRLSFVDEVVVATDHERIAEASRQVGAVAVMTDPDLPSGTDRIQRAMIGRDGDIVINVQGDEPLMPVETVRDAHHALINSGANVSTACIPIRNKEDFLAPHVVKVVRGESDSALYFSRSPIPSLVRRDESELSAEGYVYGYKHLGLYVYTRESLERFCQLPPSILENQEKLEQLRMLENGMKIVCVTSNHDSIGVDVQEDVEKVEQILKQQAGG